MENTNTNASSPVITVNQPNMTIEPRDIILPILLTFLTCGLYALYWQYKLTNEIHALSGKPQTTSGGMAVFYTIITFTFYGYYWLYKIGKELSLLRQEKDLNPDSVSNSTYNKVIIVVTILGLMWGAFCGGLNYLGTVLGTIGEQPYPHEGVAVFTFFTIVLMALSFCFHIFVTPILLLYVNKREMKEPSTLYVLLALMRTQVFTMAFVQVSLNDLLRNMPKEMVDDGIEKENVAIN